MGETEDKPKRAWWFIAILVAVMGWVGWTLLSGGGGEPQEAEAAAAADTPSTLPKRRRGLDLPPLATQQSRASVSGRVIDTAGNTVAGATVCAWPNRVELRGAGERFPRCSESKADGTYRIEGLFAVRVSISATAPTFIPAWHKPEGHQGPAWNVPKIRLLAGKDFSGADVVLEPGGVKVVGVVKDVAGGEVGGALIRAGGGWFGGTRAATAVAFADDEGTFELWTKEGETTLTGDALGYASASLQVLAPGEFAEIFLTPESVLVGKVVATGSGVPVVGAQISVSGDVPWMGGSANEAQTDEEGRFQISGLEPGAYKPSATTDDAFGLAAQKVHLGLGETSDEIVIEVHPAYTVQGTVMLDTDPNVRCEAGAGVQLVNEASKAQLYAELDEESVATVRGVLPGTYRVVVSCPGYVSMDEYGKVVVESESLLGLEWYVTEGRAILGRVVDDTGAPVSGISVYAQAKTDKADPRARQVNSWNGETEADGSFKVSGLIPATYTVRAWTRDRPAPKDPVDVVVAPGEDARDVVLELPASGRLEGVVKDAKGNGVGGVQVRAESGEARWERNGNSRTADDGTFVMKHLREGEYRVTARRNWWTQLRAPGTSDDDEQGERVSVALGETARVELVVENPDGRITGRVLDEDGGVISDAFITVSRQSDSAAARQGGGRRGVRWSWGKKPILTDQDGNFTAEELTDGKYTVRAQRKGGGEVIAEDVPVNTHVDLTIEVNGELSGKVAAADGVHPDRFRVSLSDREAGVYESDSFYRTDGAWTITHLPAGNYEVTVTSDLGDAKEEGVALKEGEKRSGLSMILKAKVELRGRVVDLESGEPVAGMRVMASSAGGGFMFTAGMDDGKNDRKHISDADGRFELESVPTGSVRIFVGPVNWSDQENAYAQAWVIKTIAADPKEQDIGEIGLVRKRTKGDERGGELGFKTKQSDPSEKPEDKRWVVAVVTPGGPAEAAGLAVGDEILTVAGQDVTGENSYRYRGLTRVPEGDAVELGLSGERSVSVVAGPALGK